MTSSLKPLLESINQVRSEPDLRSQIVPKIGEHFAAKRRAIFFFDSLEKTLREHPSFKNRNLQKILKIALSIEHNPLARYLVERHAPVHEALVASPKAWQLICLRPDHWHVMVGPLIDRGQLVGAIACTREKAMPAFDAENLIDLSALCLHISVWAATVRPQPLLNKANCLTPRELQIAELVALGRTNSEIGAELWITENSVKQALKRMFCKLEVASRAEMVAQLLATNQTGAKASGALNCCPPSISNPQR